MKRQEFEKKKRDIVKEYNQDVGAIAGIIMMLIVAYAAKILKIPVRIEFWVVIIVTLTVIAVYRKHQMNKLGLR